MENQTHAHASGEKITAGAHDTFWVNSSEPLVFRKLEENLETDVVIVGGGIAGMSVAYNLVKSGKKVVLVEDGFIGSGETGRTTAHLVTALDDRYYELERMFGKKKTALIAESHSKAINFVEETVKSEHISCDFERVDGFLFLHPSDSEDSLYKELEAARNAGVGVSIVDEVPGIEKYKGQALRFESQAQFHPLKYLKGLSKVIESKGGRIYTNTHAKEVDHTGIVTDEGFRVNAKHVVVATNSPVNNSFTMHLKQYAYRTYVIATKIKKGSLPKALWWDSGDFDVNENIPPYHYIRTQGFDDTHDLLIIGGEDHAVGLADVEGKTEEQRYKLLEDWAKQFFEINEIVYQWSGQVLEPMDGVAYIGKNPFDKQTIYIVTGDSGNGMTHATIAGTLITDLINGVENKFEALYNPSRIKPFTAGSVFFKEFIGGLKTYNAAKKRDIEKSELSFLEKNQGKIMDLDGKKFGVFRDESNNVHFVGAECTHLQCMVRWNNDEKSWDCPCHGSRFSHEGKVLNGPANSDLPYHKETNE
ncbi:(2Fe-2S)-binding protein [Sphingobacteriaceae bacterium]|nr:(2Fe-2S)-binding protein [Sphingobacteriaceae bacterium]